MALYFMALEINVHDATWRFEGGSWKRYPLSVKKEPLALINNWRPVVNGEIVQDGDVWINPSRGYLSPDNGAPVDERFQGRVYSSGWTTVHRGWTMWRGAKGPVRLPLNKIFSKPLPLP